LLLLLCPCVVLCHNVWLSHRHLSIIDCLMAHTACLVCFISTVNGGSKKERKAAYLN
jgi:hypothetical protein